MRFSDALDKKIEEFERPANLPAGHYNFRISRHPDVSDLTSKDGAVYDRITFNCNVISAGDDVDEDDLREFGDVTKVMVRKQFLIPDGDVDAAGYDRGLFQVRNFLESCGISPDLEMGEALAESINADFFGELTHRADKSNPEVVYQEIGRTAPAE